MSSELMEDVTRRLGETEAWQRKADTTFATVTQQLASLAAGLGDLRDTLTSDRTGRRQNSRELIGWIIGSITIVGAGMTFFVSSEIDKSLYPVSQRVAAVEASNTAQTSVIGHLQELMDAGRSERVKQYEGMDERLVRVEDYLDLLRGGKLK